MSTKITSNRKLQQEVDGLMKKVTEQMAAFDDLFQKALEAEGTPKREKVVAELKKELNKLQRSNHELKSMAGNSDIRDDGILVEHTKKIQTAMGEYWELEKGAKTKKFSDRSLGSSSKNSVEDEQRIAQENWLVDSLDQLKQQKESAEFTLERDRGVAAASTTGGGGKGGKRKGGKSAAATTVISTEELDLRELCLITRSKYHTFKIESLLRALRNGNLDAYSIASTQDEIAQVLEELKSGDTSDPEWKDMDEGIYEAFDLPELAAKDDSEDEDEDAEATGGMEKKRRDSDAALATSTPPTTSNSASPTKKGKKTKQAAPEEQHVDPVEGEPAVPVWTGKAAIPQTKEQPVSEIGKVIARAKENTTTPAGGGGNRSGGNSPSPQNNFAATPAATAPAAAPAQPAALPSLGGNNAAMGGVWGRPAVVQQTSASIAAQKVASAPSLDSLAAPSLPDSGARTQPASKGGKRKGDEQPILEQPQPEILVGKKGSAAAKTATKKHAQPEPTKPVVTSLGAPAVPASTSPWGSKKNTDKNRTAALTGESTDAVGSNIVFDATAALADTIDLVGEEPPLRPAFPMEDSPQEKNTVVHHHHPNNSHSNTIITNPADKNVSSVASLWGSDPSAASTSTHSVVEPDVVVAPKKEVVPEVVAPTVNADPPTESEQQFDSILNLLKGMGQDDDTTGNGQESSTGLSGAGGATGGTFGGGTGPSFMGALNHQADPFTSSGGLLGNGSPTQPNTGVGSLLNGGSTDFLPQSGQQQQQPQQSHHQQSHHQPPHMMQDPMRQQQPPQSSGQLGDEPEWNPRNGMNAGAVPFLVPGGQPQSTPSNQQGTPTAMPNSAGSWGSPAGTRSGFPGPPQQPQAHHQQPPPPPPHQPPPHPQQAQAQQQQQQQGGLGVSPPVVPATPPSYNESQTPPMYSQSRPQFPQGSSAGNPPPLPNMPPSVVSKELEQQQRSTTTSAPWPPQQQQQQQQPTPQTANARTTPGYMPPPDSQRNKLYAPQPAQGGVAPPPPPQQPSQAQLAAQAQQRPGAPGAPPAGVPQASFGQPPALVAPRSQQMAAAHVPQPGYVQPTQQLIPRVGGVNPPTGQFAPRNGESGAPDAQAAPLLGGGGDQQARPAPPSLMSMMGNQQQSQSAGGGSSGVNTPASASIPGTPMKTQVSTGSPVVPGAPPMPAPAVTHVFWDYSTVRPSRVAGGNSAAEPKRETSKFWKQVTEVLRQQPNGKYFVKASLTKPQVFFRQAETKEMNVVETLNLLRVSHSTAADPRKAMVESIKQLFVDSGLLTFNDAPQATESEEDEEEAEYVPAIGQRAPGANTQAIKVVLITADPCCGEALSLCERAGVNFCVLHGFEDDSEDADILNYWVEKAPKVSLRSHDLLKDVVEVVPRQAAVTPVAPALTAAAKLKMGTQAHQAQQQQSASTTKKGPIGGAAAAPVKGKRGY